VNRIGIAPVGSKSSTILNSLSEQREFQSLGLSVSPLQQEMREKMKVMIMALSFDQATR